MTRPSGMPGRDCPRCARLVAFRNSWREREPQWFNAPVDSFGPLDARLLIVGLAPGLRGANRTGRPFTGDYAGDLLYATLTKFGFTRGDYAGHPGDGLVLDRARITNAVRCVPPQNKPETVEIAACRSFLAAELAALPKLRAVLALGAATPVMAYDSGDQISMQAALDVATDLGVMTVSNTQFLGDEWQIEGRDYRGRWIEVYVDSQTGAVRNVDRDW